MQPHLSHLRSCHKTVSIPKKKELIYSVLAGVENKKARGTEVNFPTYLPMQHLNSKGRNNRRDFIAFYWTFALPDDFKRPLLNHFKEKELYMYRGSNNSRFRTSLLVHTLILLQRISFHWFTQVVWQRFLYRRLFLTEACIFIRAGDPHRGPTLGSLSAT